MPFSTYSTIQRNFSNSGTNQLLISRGCSYLKQTHMILRPSTIVESPYYMNDGGRFGDFFKSVQYEIGSKLYHPQKIDTKIGMFREKDIAFEQYGHQLQGSVVDFDTFSCSQNRFNSKAVYYPPTTALTGEVQQPNLETKQDFLMSMNYEKIIGSSALSGVNSRLSGYNLHVTLELDTGLPDENGEDDAHNAQRALRPNYDWRNSNIQLLCWMHHDRSLILARDTVQVSE